MRVAYIDEREETIQGKKTEKVYYSVLVKGGDKLDEVLVNYINMKQYKNHFQEE